MAARGGSSLDDNPALRLAFTRSRAANIPRDTIQRAIEKGSGEGGGAELRAEVFEGYGNAGIAVIVETLTDNQNRTVAEVRHAFSRHGGSLGKTGSVAFQFQRVGHVVIELNEEAGIDEERVFDIAVEAGTEDIETAEGYAHLFTDFNALHSLLVTLESSEIAIEEAQIEYRPNDLISLDEEKREGVLAMIERLDDLDDVQHVWHNLEEEVDS